MLQVKGKLEMERNELAKERAALTKNEQSTILNKGGAMRAPIKISFGKWWLDFLICEPVSNNILYYVSSNSSII